MGDFYWLLAYGVKWLQPSLAVGLISYGKYAIRVFYLGYIVRRGEIQKISHAFERSYLN